MIPRSQFRRPRSQAGLTLIEAIIGLTIIAVATIGLNQLSNYFSEETEAAVAAEQLRSFGEATRKYIRDNYSAVQAVATAGQPALIDAPTLVAAQALPSGYLNSNAYGQATCALVFQPAPNKLQAIVITEGGKQLGDPTLGSIAMAVGGSGGGVYSMEPAAIRGTVGGWAIPVADVDDKVNNLGRRCDGSGGNVRAEVGRSVMALWFENGDTSSAFLARDAVPGRPELNAMNTPLVMNSIQVEGQACAAGGIARDTEGGLLTCRDAVWTKVAPACIQDTVSDLNALEEDGWCITGAANPNSPAGADGFFMEVLRHPDKTTFFTSQRAIGLTGSAVGKVWYRTQNSVASGGGWSAWNQTADPGVSLGAGTVEAAGNVLAAGTVQGANIYSTGDIRGNGTIHNTTGTIRNDADNWALIGRNQAGVENATAQSPVGSANVNDVYIRSTGKWASQMGALDVQSNYCGGDSCAVYLPSYGYWVIHGVARGHQNAWCGGGFAIAGVYVDGLANFGDQAGTGYAPMMGNWQGWAGPGYVYSSQWYCGNWGDMRTSLIAIRKL